MTEYLEQLLPDIFFNTMPERFKPEEAKDVDMSFGCEGNRRGTGNGGDHL